MNYRGIRVILPDSLTQGNAVGAITPLTNVSLKENEDYIFQFKIINYAEVNILDNIKLISESDVKTDLPDIKITDFPIVNTFIDEGLTKNEYLCHIQFKSPTSEKYKFMIGRTIKTMDESNAKIFDIREVCCEKGTMLQDYKENAIEIQEYIEKFETLFEQTDRKLSMTAKQDNVNQTYAQIQVEVDNINLEVAKKVDGETVISSINMSPEEIQIDAEKINMSGALNLNGTFTCYANAKSKNGNYLFQSGAIHRGYLEGWNQPVFSSGIWKPDGINDVGYVSVGWSNSDHVDANGCLWMSPQVGGGASLHYGQLVNNEGRNSGIDYNINGTVNYSSFLTTKQNDDVASHIFDGGLSAYTVKSNFISCDGAVRCDSTLYTKTTDLYLMSGGWTNKYFLQFNSSGYLYGKDIQLGSADNAFYQMYSYYPVQVTSDIRQKENIHYLNTANSNVEIMSKSTKRGETPLMLEDMYDYIKDLKLASYTLKNIKGNNTPKTEIGFIAQDIVGNKVGDYIINSNDSENLVYDMGNRVSVLEGALKIAIEKIEILEEKIINLNNQLNNSIK